MAHAYGLIGGGGGGIKLASIAITSQPTKTAYKAGESFDTTGMVVTATYSNEATAQATGYLITPSGPLSVSDTTITIIYTEQGVTKTATQAITVTKTSLTVPSQSGTLTYSGSSKTPSWSNYDSTKMTIGGTTSSTNAGTYTATFTLKDTSLYQWSDGTTAAKSVSWTIGKATGTLTVSTTSISLDKTTTSATFTIGGDYDGTVSVQSNDTTVATVSKSGTTVTVSSVNSTTGSTTITVSCTAGTNYTAPSNKTVSVAAKFVTIYGVEWDGTSTTALSRTDASASFTDPVPYVSGASSYSSPFDNLLPWSGMVKETDDEAGVLVKIPKFYYKWTKSGTTLKLQIADGQVDGYFVSPAHADRGDGNGERDYVYVGRYHCAGGYTSKTSASPKVSITRSAARTNIHNLGSTIWQFDYAMRLTIQMLYLVEFADWDSQTKIGYGCGNNSAAQNTGASDSMPYHTGTMKSSRTTYGAGVQYRYIEGLWDTVYDWMDGCYYSSAGMSVIMNPNNFSDTANGTSIGTPTGGWISAFNVVESGGVQWIISGGASGSNTTYVPDIWVFSASYPCLRVGGDYGQSLNRGLFCVGYDAATGTGTSIGCRLQKLP